VSDALLLKQPVGWSLALLDDALIAVVAGLLVFLYERQQTRNIIRKLDVIRLMNHDVRNSLQVILYSASVSDREKLTTEVLDAAGRIEWALREVLPGQREDIKNLLLDRSQSCGVHKSSCPIASTPTHLSTDVRS
jgi:hypothetical protein